MAHQQMGAAQQTGLQHQLIDSRTVCERIKLLETCGITGDHSANDFRSRPIIIGPFVVHRPYMTANRLEKKLRFGIGVLARQYAKGIDCLCVDVVIGHIREPSYISAHTIGIAIEQKNEAIPLLVRNESGHTLFGNVFACGKVFAHRAHFHQSNQPAMRA